ncbi:MAG: long-chain fatty acid--CoA ligase, partial [Solirubrobacterales bacterium]|nr:long-chain fatty acid--CoA ligase [Solirubrobacterales bacterium]
LPLAHSLARVVQFVVLDVGGTVAFWRGDPTRVPADLAELHPTHLPAVPRVFEKIRTRALATAEDGGRLQRVGLAWALGVGRRVRVAERAGRPVGRLLAAEHRVADRLALARVRALFGPDLRLALTGAAPMPREVIEFFDACGVLILEGYGLTETTAAGTLNTERAVRFGSVGRPLPGSEVAIAADGEIVLRGPHVFPGYHDDPAATAAALSEDGWLRSGDLGRIDGDGYVHVTGRQKDLIITSSGKNVSAANVEAALREIRWVSQAVAYGDGRPYLVALLTLDPEEAGALADRVGAQTAAIPTLAADERVRALLGEELDAVNRRFARIEQIKRFDVLDSDLTQAGGDLTPTQKVKRAVVHRRHAARFAALYD